MTEISKQEVLLSALMKLSQQFQDTMKWSTNASEDEKTLVVGNLNGFCAFISRTDIDDLKPQDAVSLANADAASAIVNPISQVYFRAGLLVARESLAKFVESGSPTIAASIRANWWPRLGNDPGVPRKLDWNEVADEQPDGSIGHKLIEPSVEALPFAYGFLCSDESPKDWRIGKRCQPKLRSHEWFGHQGVILDVLPDGYDGIADKNGVLKVHLDCIKIIVGASEDWVQA